MENENSRKVNYKILLVALAGLLVIGSIFFVYQITGNVVSNNAEVTSVKIAYLPAVNSLPLYVAMEKGYFVQEGINVEAVKFDSPQLILDSLVSNQVDFGAPGSATGIASIIDYRTPGKLKVFDLVGGTHDNIADVLIIGKASNLSSISDLRGKTLGILPGIQFRTIAREILAKNNVSYDEVNIVEIATSLQVQALASKQVDAVLGLEPVRTIAISKGIGKDLVKSPIVEYIADPWFGGAGLIRGDFAKENPETTKKVISAIGKAVDDINANPNETRKYLIGYTSLDENLSKIVSIPTYTNYEDFTNKDMDALQKFIDIFTQYKVIDGKVNVRDMIYRP
jgi:NitT/TauT family transport system substrate-binding protein